MTTTATEARARPAIEPIRTTGPDLAARSFRARMALKSPAWSASPLSPRSLPLPGCQELRDEQMRQHDKMAVDRLETRGCDSPSKLEPSLRNVSLRPIAQLALPTTPSTLPARRSPQSAPLFAPPAYRRSTIVEETRNMLLHEPGGGQDGSPAQGYERRQSAPSGVLHARAMQIVRQREHLRRRGFVGSYRPREAELLVMPVELRRLSTITGAEPPSPCPVDGRLTTRVVVHSRGRKPLFLTRTFDLDELRATLPRVSPADQASWSRRASVATLQPPPTANRPSSPGLVTERRHSHGALPALSPQRPSPSERRSSRQGLSSVAIHLEYARTYLPVLAAIILSEIVRPGDTIELPLPHPRAWEDTVAYIYTGRVGLTEPIRQNILYLGGKV